MIHYKYKASEEMGIQEGEMNLVKKFFDEEIRGKDASIVLEIYKEFFRDIVDENFKQILSYFYLSILNLHLNIFLSK